MEIESQRHLLVNSMEMSEMSIGKSDPIIHLTPLSTQEKRQGNMPIG